MEEKSSKRKEMAEGIEDDLVSIAQITNDAKVIIHKASVLSEGVKGCVKLCKKNLNPLENVTLNLKRISKLKEQLTAVQNRIENARAPYAEKVDEFIGFLDNNFDNKNYAVVTKEQQMLNGILAKFAKKLVAANKQLNKLEQTMTTWEEKLSG